MPASGQRSQGKTRDLYLRLGFVKRGRFTEVWLKDVLEKVQNLLNQGMEIPDIAKKEGLKADTMNAAVRDGRLH